MRVLHVMEREKKEEEKRRREEEKRKKDAKKREETARLETLYQEGNVAFKAQAYDRAFDIFMEVFTMNPNYRDIQKQLVKAHKAKEKGRKTAATKKEGTRRETSVSQPKEYTVNLGDIMDISVWEWPDLRMSDVYVRPDGKISFPLVGDVDAVERTLTEIDKEITERLTEFIKSPEVSISIKRFGGKKVIIMGEVSGPGVYAPTGQSTLLEVIALAGGFTPAAVTTNVVVIRGDQQRSEAIVCDLRRAIKNGDLSENIVAERNDIIYVPRRFIASASDLASEIGGPLGTLLSLSAVAKDYKFHRPRDIDWPGH